MNPKVKDVIPKDDYTLVLTFENDEMRKLIVKPYLDKGIFSELKDETYFRTVKVEAGCLEWSNGQGLSNNTVYIVGEPIEENVQSEVVSNHK